MSGIDKYGDLRPPGKRRVSSNAAVLEFSHRAGADAGARAEVVRAREGDTAAFEELLRRHERLVFGTAWRLLGTVEDAQDAAQEVFLRLYRHLDRLDPERSLSPWLYRVTVNVCNDLGRKRRTSKSVPLGEADAAAPLAAGGAESDPAARLALGEEKRMIAEGLGKLTGKERAALVLRDLEGLTTGEVAKILGSSPTTIRTHVCRARLKLKAFRDRWLKRTAP